MRNTLLVAVLISVSIVAPLFAHHSFDAQYDSLNPITLTGEITGGDWINPHSSLWIAVTDSNGKIQNWHVEGGPPNFLRQAGWTQEMLSKMIKSHDTVIASGFQSKSAPPLESDIGKPFSLTGTVAQLDFVNPFSFLYVDANEVVPKIRTSE